LALMSIQHNAARRREDFESCGCRDRAFSRGDSDRNSPLDCPFTPSPSISASAVNENRSMREFLRFRGTREAQKRDLEREHRESRGEGR